MTNDADKSLTYDPSDEHLQVLIGKNIRVCQQSQQTKFDDINKKASSAHCRIDCIEDRLVGLDHKEVGKVTILWMERNKIIAIGAALMAAVIVNLFIDLSHKPEKINKEELTRVVEEAIQGVVVKQH